MTAAVISPLEAAAKPFSGFGGKTDRRVRDINLNDHAIKDYLAKMQCPNCPHPGDVILVGPDLAILGKVVKKLGQIQAMVGFGNFRIINFDDAVKTAAKHASIGTFTKDELDFIERIFYKDASIYGFMGEKQLTSLTSRIDRKEIYQVPHNGNYLFRGESLAKYNQLKKIIGSEMILTSGIRGVTKQFLLYLAKAYRHQGNMSLASRSLAPPGYSYHATGDFDVGQTGLGKNNFSLKFTSTRVFHQLADLGYVKYRYERNNMLGVRYEPWHIKV